MRPLRARFIANRNGCWHPHAWAASAVDNTGAFRA
jgi:hypothetical protein